MSALAICLNPPMGIQDNWHANLLALVEAEGNGIERRGFKAIAAKAELSEEYIYQVAKKKPRPDGKPREIGKQAALKIAAAYSEGRPPGWFDQSPAIVNAAKQAADELTLTHYDTGGSMGRGLVLKDQPGAIQSWKVTKEWVQKNVPYYTSLENLSIVTGFGDSMTGMFNPGDPLLVDRGITKCDVDGVYFFRVGEEGFIKRLQRLPGPEGEIRIKVKSKNPDYDDWWVEKGMDFHVMAKVLRAWNGQNL
jgi:hypothetical protein